LNWRFLYRAFRARYRDQRRELQAILAVLRPGDLAADVGAHKGAYLYWMRRAVGGTGKVFAFEPQARLAAYLEALRAGMKWDNVAVRNCALSDTPGKATLHIPGQGDSPGASLEAAVLTAAPGHRQECEVDTLDQQLQDAGRLALLKVDVEGYELQVFRGGQRILARDTPVILFECEARHLHGHTMQDVFTFLEGLGYQGSFFAAQGLRPLGEFDPDVHQRHDAGRFWDAPSYCNNFLFEAPGKGPRAQGQGPRANG
jgi:FkbM family methyltransferase